MRRAPVIILSAFSVCLLAAGCALTSHPVEQADLGTPRSSDDLVALLSTPGPIELETVASVDWEVQRSGLVNLDHPKARAAGLEDGAEPIQVYFHAVRHPEKGLFIVDTGVESMLRDDPSRAAIRGIVASFMHMDKMKFNRSLGDWLAASRQDLAGVFLTHLHLDHVSGMPDVPASAPVYAGPGETAARALTHLVLRGNIDRALANKGPLREWTYRDDSGSRFAGVLDVLGDGSLWALWVPGHTPGSTAYLVRTRRGPVLLVGDACHTRWGWENGVEPGTFSADLAQSARSLAQLKQFVADHPQIEVRLGHQR